MEMQLDLSQFRNSVIAVSDEQYRQFKEESERKRIERNGTYSMAITEISDAKIAQNDAAWLQCVIKLECPEGVAEEYLMLPLTSRLEFGAKGTRFVILKTIEVLNALGFSKEEQRNQFFNKVLLTNGEILQHLKGFRVNYSLEWDKAAVHFEYDRDAQVHYLCDWEGKKWAPNQPFVGEFAERKRRALDFCGQANVRFQERARTVLSVDPSTAKAPNPVISVLALGPQIVVSAPMPAVLSSQPGALPQPPAPAILNQQVHAIPNPVTSTHALPTAPIATPAMLAAQPPAPVPTTTSTPLPVAPSLSAMPSFSPASFIRPPAGAPASSGLPPAPASDDDVPF
jgi:hypothetical protein